ncbi:MAG: YicC family protein [Alphaproteobacteria bacterium]|nr:YicC family protein [Alphaproteobacteria bacterium]
MSVNSMTGFARTGGGVESVEWFWELRSVNGKGFDLRLRLPPGFDGIEAKLRALAMKRFSRGTIHASLNLTRQSGTSTVRLNEAVLGQVVEAARRACEITGGQMPDTASLLGLRGVLEISEAELGAGLEAEVLEPLVSDFESALGELAAARAAEGQRMAIIVDQLIDEIERLTKVVEVAPARSVGAIKARLGEQVRRVLDAEQSMEADRLHQEAVLLATRADVEEELKRLYSHVAAARELLRDGGVIGRKMDFLAQEFQREANTLCSKSNDAEITAAGLAMKVKIDQMREQVQNLE